MAVAHAVPRDTGLDIVRQAADERALQIFFPLEIREVRLLFGERNRRPKGGVTNEAHHVGRGGQCAILAIAQPEHDERIGEPRDAEPEAPRAAGIVGVLPKGEMRGVDHVVEQADRERDRIRQPCGVDPGLRREWRRHETGEIDRAEVACPEGRQGDFPAGVGGADPLAIPKIVVPVDAIDEQHAGLGIVIRGCAPIARAL
ncbi:MAG TPA: hypothetical protein VLX44_03225 [Xanthobacteraceae bacterium]|nr:hypothetical protein [Xanthobacteraceae bacterium]